MFSYFKEYFDFRVLFVCVALVIVGLICIYSATFDINNAANFHRQALWAGIGFIIMIVISFVPLRTLQRLSITFYFIAIATLVIILVVGSTVKGSKSWFGLIGLGGQPSEFAKITTVLAFASYISKTDVSISKVKHLFISLGIFAVPMFLILAQPDLGTTIVFFVVLLPLLYWAGASNFILVSIIVPILAAFGALLGTTYFIIAVAIGAVLLYIFRENKFTVAVAFGIMLAIGLSVQVMYESMHVYQQKRISAFLNPEADPLGAGYNVVQSKIAIGSGGFFGKGFLKGTQTQLNYIPEQWTDFIFCVTGEEFGTLGASIVLGLFAALLLHALRVASISRNRFSSLAAIGIMGIFGTHIVINTGMSMGLMPVVGLPLPFLSYGGSSLVANMIMAGLLMNFYANRKEY